MHSGAEESTRTLPRAHPAVSCFTVVVQLFRLWLLRLLSAKETLLGNLLLQMPHTTACVFVADVRILSFLHINSDIVQLRGLESVSIHDILKYNFPLKRYTVIHHCHLFSLHVITALREHDLLCLPIDSLHWQLMERWCQGRNIKTYLCKDFLSINAKLQILFCVLLFWHGIRVTHILSAYHSVYLWLEIL